MKEYEFDVNAVYYGIRDHWTDFMKKLNSTRVIIGISGGIDSTCCVFLAKKTFGEENIYGISMPCDSQKDISDVDKVFEATKIKRLKFDIGDCNCDILNGIENNGMAVSEQTKINLPPRLRMAVLYAFAQSLNAVVINTSNRSEANVNWDTVFGDDCGSYAPIQDLTKTEVKLLAKSIDVPKELVEKVPIDGLRGTSDEDNFGFIYEELDRFIRTGYASESLKENIMKRYDSGRYKLEMVRIVGPKFGYPDYIRGENT